eukprot:Clim_evm128s157 gene=Clim_evmTU128s157
MASNSIENVEALKAAEVPGGRSRGSNGSNISKSDTQEVPVDPVEGDSRNASPERVPQTPVEESAAQADEEANPAESDTEEHATTPPDPERRVSHASWNVSPMDDLPEIPTGVECRCVSKLTRNSSVAVDTVIPIAKERVMGLCFHGDYDVWDKYTREEPSLAKFADTDYHRGGWVVSKNGCCLERHLKFRSPAVDMPFGIGSNTTRITHVHRVRWSKVGLLYHTRAFAYDVPYGESFVVDNEWIFANNRKGPGTHFKVLVDVRFIKSCWVKNIIRSTAIGPAVDNAKKTAQLLVNVAKAAAPRLDREEAAASPAGDFRKSLAVNSEAFLIPEQEEYEGQRDETESVDEVPREILERAPTAIFVSVVAFCVGFFYLYVKQLETQAATATLTREVAALKLALVEAFPKSELATKLTGQSMEVLEEFNDRRMLAEKALQDYMTVMSKIDSQMGSVIEAQLHAVGGHSGYSFSWFEVTLVIVILAAAAAMAAWTQLPTARELVRKYQDYLPHVGTNEDDEAPSFDIDAPEAAKKLDRRVTQILLREASMGGPATPHSTDSHLETVPENSD